MLSNSQSFSSQSNPLDEHDYCSPRKGPPPTPFSSQSPTHKTNVTPFALNEASNDSVASSSSISSEDSTRDLMIDQDGQKGGPLAPKDTPSVSKSKLGRRPLIKKQFEKAQQKHIERNQQQQARPRKPRQSTSVTDKSQWITGEEQVDSALSEHTVEVREKRQRKEKVHDPEFSHFTSSEYSESDQDSEVDEEDDPTRPWCDCNRPDDGKLMLQCDICKYWFHGSCVGQTQKMSDKRELEKKEWFCSTCDHAMSNGTPREAIPKRLVEKEKKKSTKSGKSRGRPKKDGRASEINTRQSARNAKKLNHSLDSKSALNRKSDARSKSFDMFDDSERLKALIKERKRSFFFKQRLAEQNEADKVKDRHNMRSSMAGSLGNSLDSVASNTNSPNMNNLPINIRHKDRSKPNIVLQINTKKDKDAELSDQRIVTTIVKKRKHSELNDPNGNGLFTADPIQLGKKSKAHPQLDNPTGPVVKTEVSGDRSSPGGDTKFVSEAEKQSSTKHHSASKKKRKDSEASSSNGSSKYLCPEKVAEKFKECLNDRRKSFTDLDISSADVGKLASDIERQLNDCFKVQKQQINKYRSLLFNLRDPKNKVLVRNVLDGTIKPDRLVRMEPAEMASLELAKWREQESKHAIEMIKRESELAAQEVIVKKTHKGEEVIAASSLNDSDDLNISKNDHDTPTKAPKAVLTLPDNAKSKESTNDKVSSKVTKLEPETSQPSFIESLVFLDTTSNHGNHSYDMNCKICNKVQTADSVKQETTKSPEAETIALNTNIDIRNEPIPQLKEPKRLRISIQTNLDPADLSKLREPLIKPKEEAQNNAEYSPSKISPTSESPNQEVDEDNEELYDPETSTIPPHSLINPKPESLNSECWSGTISSSQIAKFNAIAKPVSGDVAFMSSKVSRTLSICGRIPPDQVGSYIKKLRTTTKNQILLVQLFPSTEDDRASFNTFFDHLYTRNRCGVIEAGAFQPFLKDFYLLPIHENGHIPEYLKPIESPGLIRKDPNCLLGLLVKTKRPSSASSSSSNNTPTLAK